MLDLSSAYDTVDHTLLLSILENRFSVTGSFLECFRCYLTDRTHVFTAGLTSSPTPPPLAFGVPQGSGLGPFEFIAYTETTTDIFSEHHIQSYFLMTHNAMTIVPSLMFVLFYPACQLMSMIWAHFILHFACSSTHSKLNSFCLVLDPTSTLNSTKFICQPG